MREHCLVHHEVHRQRLKSTPAILKLKDNQVKSQLRILSFHLEIVRIWIPRGRISVAVKVLLVTRNVEITYDTKEYLETISQYIDEGILFKESQSNLVRIEINASYFKIKRQFSANTTKHFLFPFGNCENVDPPRTNLVGGHSLIILHVKK